MNRAKRILLIAVLCSTSFVALLTACNNDDDTITASVQNDKVMGVAAPGIMETKAIAEEAFIYGLPIVMNYAVMQEFAVDKNSGQYKAPFNTIKNPINRYLINSPMLPGMKQNADGSLTLYIQKDSPGKEKEANWLPATNGEIYLVMRLYWPKTEAPSILPVGKGSWSPPSVVKV